MSTAPMTQDKKGGGGSSIVDGEFVLTKEDFSKIASMLHGTAGIHLPESKATLVYSRLTKRLRALGLESFRDYCAHISSDQGADERLKMLAALTTNVTKFFREPHHFDHLRTVVLPPLLQAARAGARVRIWSAGCSNGQEPYSIALTILGLLPDAANFDIKVLATDIDPVIIEEAREGVYPASALDNVPAPLRTKWFRPVGQDGGKSFKVNAELSELVTVRELNLIGQWPMKGTFQALFCRNVTIYFTDETREKLWSRFSKCLAPGGYLYIGHSERITGPAARSFAPAGVTTYRWLGENS